MIDNYHKQLEQIKRQKMQEQYEKQQEQELLNRIRERSNSPIN
jgi:hypothetical protein